MPNDFSATMRQAANVEEIFVRTSGLLVEFAGVESEAIDFVFHERWDVTTGSLSPPIRRDRFRRHEIGPGHPDCWTDLRLGALGLASMSTGVDPSISEYSVWAGPDTRTASSYLLAICTLISVSELTAGTIYSILGRDETSPEDLLALVRAPRGLGSTTEERAMNRLRMIRGFEEYYQFGESPR